MMDNAPDDSVSELDEDGNAIDTIRWKADFDLSDMTVVNRAWRRCMKIVAEVHARGGVVKLAYFFLNFRN